MYSITKTDVVHALFVAAAILVCATAFSFVAPSGVAYADLDFGGSAEWGDCCASVDCCADVGGGDCCYGGDAGGDCCYDSGWSDCCWGGDTGCCVDTGDCCIDTGDCCVDTGDCCTDGGDCCYGGDDCCSTGGGDYCCDSYDDYWTSCDSCSSGGGGEMYYSSSSYTPPKFSIPSFSYPKSYPVSYPMSVSYPKSYNPPPIHVSTGTSYVPSTPVINNVNNNTNTNTNVNNISVTAVAVAPAVAQPTIGYTYQTPAPYCTISLTNYYGVGYGQRTLTWSSVNATSATIYPYIGSVSTSGSQIVYPVANQIYTMTVYGNGGTATCQTQAYASAPIVTTPAPYVALTQIPYTGFDFGPVGNALYWMSLAAVAVAGAYLVVYYMPAMFAARATHETVPVSFSLPVVSEKEVETKRSDSIRNTIDSMVFSSNGISIRRS